MDSRKNKSVAVDEARVLGIEGHDFVEQDVRDGGHSWERASVKLLGDTAPDTNPSERRDGHCSL